MLFLENLLRISQKVFINGDLQIYGSVFYHLFSILQHEWTLKVRAYYMIVQNLPLNIFKLLYATLLNHSNYVFNLWSMKENVLDEKRRLGSGGRMRFEGSRIHFDLNQIFGSLFKKCSTIFGVSIKQNTSLFFKGLRHSQSTHKNQDDDPGGCSTIRMALMNGVQPTDNQPIWRVETEKGRGTRVLYWYIYYRLIVAPASNV